MPNDLLPNQPSTLRIVPNDAVQAVQQTGEKNVYASHVEKSGFDRGTAGIGVSAVIGGEH